MKNDSTILVLKWKPVLDFFEVNYIEKVAKVLETSESKINKKPHLILDICKEYDSQNEIKMFD